MVRALQLLFGLALAVGGGLCIWLRKESPGGVFNVTDTETLWLVALGLVLTLFGLVLFLMGMSPRAKVEQINWRYPDTSPNVDLSGPAFADEENQPQANNIEHPSWLQATPENSDVASPDHSTHVAAAGVALVGGAAAASAFGSSQEETQSNEGPEYPREELPFERPRFNAEGFQPIEETETVIDSTEQATSFVEPDIPKFESSPQAEAIETPSNVVQEEQILEELAADMDSQLNDQDIDALAMEAASATMDDGFVLDTPELETETTFQSSNEETEISVDTLPVASSDEDDAFEAQLNALSNAGTSAAVVSLNDNEDALPEEGELTQFTDDQDDNISSEAVTFAEEDLPAIDISEPELGSVDAQVLETETELDFAPEEDVSLDEIETESLDIDIPDLVDSPEDTSADDEDINPSLQTAEIDSTIEEFNSEIETLGFTEDLNVDLIEEEDSPPHEEFQTETTIESPDTESPVESLETLPDELELPELELPENSEVEAPHEQENVNLSEELVPEEIPVEDISLSADIELDELPELEPSVIVSEISEEPINSQPEDRSQVDIQTEFVEAEISEDSLNELPSAKIPADEEIQLTELSDDLPALEDISSTENETLENKTPEQIDIPEELPASEAPQELEFQNEDTDSLPDLEELPSLDEEGTLSENLDLNVLEEVELEPVQSLEIEPSPEETIVPEPVLNEPNLEPIEDLPSVEEAIVTETENSPGSEKDSTSISDLATLAASSAATSSVASNQMDIQTLAETAMSGPTESFEPDTLAPPAPFVEEQTADDSHVTHPRLLPIKEAIDAGKLEDADSLLANIRRDLVQEGDENTPELAELTALAGDHAAASGRPGGAKWLWRLALQRFGEADAIETNAAKAVSERLRQFEH